MTDNVTPTHRFAGAIAACALVLLLASCEILGPSPGGTGNTVEVSEPVTASDRARAERSIHASLTQGVERYQITPGDTLLLTFTEDLRAKQANYVIGVRDKLRVEFFYHPNASRTVVVRPDGRVTMPLMGDVIAAGLTPGDFAVRLQDMYRGTYRDPVVTVSVEEFNSPAADLIESVKTSQLGKGKQVVVGPDGMAYLPLLAPVRTTERTVEEFQSEINRLYAERFNGLTVSVSLEKIAGDRIFVFGEVRNPGMMALARPTTALQIITTAGGPLTTAALDSVKVLSWSPNGEAVVRTLDLDAVLGGQKTEGDILVGTNSVVYVPPTGITKLNRFVDQYVKQLFLFNGFSVDFAQIYQRGSRQTGITVVP